MCPAFGAQYIRLFNYPAYLLEKLSREQLEQGFWEIQSPGFDGSVGYLIGDPNLPLALRLECIRATYNLYRYFFSVDILIHSGQMWWDCILDSYELIMRLDLPESEAQDTAIRNTIFETLSQILQLESEDCQGAALHGLGHLQHPNTERVIMAYLDTHPELDAEMQDFALDCISGDIM